MPCGCVLTNTYTDPHPLGTTLLRSDFVAAAGKALSYWFKVRADSHECPHDLPEV